MAEPSLRVEVDRVRARAVAGRLSRVTPKLQHFVPDGIGPEARARTLDFLCAWVAICQQTRTLEGRVGGRWYRGSDYLVHRLAARWQEDPEALSGDRLAVVTEDDLRSWFSDDGRPESSTLDRVAERAELLRDLGRRLCDGYGGGAAGLLAASKGRLHGSFGLLARLEKFRAYRDPVRKKSFLLVQMWRQAGVFEPVDESHLGLPVDYHLVRVLVRAGVIRLSGGRAEALLAGGAATPEEDMAIRQAGVKAGWAMAKIMSLARLDLLLWMVGRNCCFYDHLPVCQTGPCGLVDRCSLRESTDLECERDCPLDGVCEASGNPRFAEYREPHFDTDLY